MNNTKKKVSGFTNSEYVRTGLKRKGRWIRKSFGLSFDIGYLGSDLTIVVPDGFETDGPSWPYWVDSVLFFIGQVLRLVGLERYLPTLESLKMIRPSTLHDYLRERLLFPKFLGDYIFLTALKADGCPFVFRWLAFIAVLLNFSRQRSTTTGFVLTELSK